MKTVILFDTETTGLIKPDATDIKDQPYITELFALKIHRDGKECIKVDEFEQRFNVPVPLSPEITRITGITDDDLKDEPTFALVFNQLAEYYTGVDELVAHNCAFDVAMLGNELVRIDKVLKFPWPRKHVCTVQATLHFQQRRLNLQALHNELFGHGFSDAHRARNDVYAMYTCYKELASRGLV